MGIQDLFAGERSEVAEAAALNIADVLQLYWHQSTDKR